ncbi:MAG: cobalamin-dependent protein [Deltaproteobacteria bacterium]|nr:MAG: cobalamin-dependent protein [Deltaproteobacteria bacterium]
MAREPKPDFERYMTALHCEEPDRVPLGDWHVDQLPKESFMGKKIVTFEDQVDFWYTAGFDFITSSSGILEPVRAPEGMTTKGDAVHTEYGDKVSREWAQEHEGVVTSLEQFEKYPWPSVDDFDLSKWDFFDKNLPKGMKAIHLLGKIYTTAWMFMGAEVFFNALETDEELTAAIFEKIGKIQYETFLRVIEHPSVGAVFNPDDIAHNTGLLVHPRHLRKYLFPWYKKMGDVCRDKGLGFIFHSDGDCTEVMDDLIDCGFHAFNPLQPNAMDIDEIKNKWGNKLCLIGNINLDSTLTLGTPQDVRAEVYERIRTIGPGGGYMVASSNSITDYVPLDNMKALIDATFEFGRYPIELAEGGVKGTVWKYQGKAKKEAAEFESQLDIEAYTTSLLSNDVSRVTGLAQKDIDSGVEVAEVISKGLIPALAEVGKKFQTGKIYIPEMMIAARMMQGTIESLKDQLADKTEKKLGNVIIGTVKGDLHDIGKNLVIMMLEGQGFTVKDLGVSVSPEQFVQHAKENKSDIVAMSALLTTTMIEMENTINALKNAELRDQVKVIVGGAPVTQKFANDIGADGYAYDAPGAAQLCKQLLPS